MAHLPAPPSKEQLQELRTFLTRCTRMSDAERMSTAPVPPGPTKALLYSWSTLVDRNLNRAGKALRDGDAEAASLAWAVVLQAAWWWRDDDDFPESVRPLLLAVHD